jgi:F-type H+-transporting ATPase subunit delta
MKDRKLAKRYARALFSALPDPATVQAADTFLDALGRAIASSSELQFLFVNPAVPRRTKKAVLAKLAGEARAGHAVASFLSVVVDHGRAGSLPAIAEAFHEIHEEAQGIVQAAITTAVPLTPELEESARSVLERLTGKRIRLNPRVDRSLIGGAVTQIGSTVYDGSLRTQLANLRRRMAGQ